MDVGGQVTGGTVCYEAPILVKATATGSASTLAGIARQARPARLGPQTPGGGGGMCGKKWEQTACRVAERSTAAGCLQCAACGCQPLPPGPPRPSRRLVADAQAREAPVQRLADVVAGRFCYGVMAASAATFAFWSLVGVNAFPGVVEDAMFAGA